MLQNLKPYWPARDWKRGDRERYDVTFHDDDLMDRGHGSNLENGLDIESAKQTNWMGLRR